MGSQWFKREYKKRVRTRRVIEFTWALILASVRHIVTERQLRRSGRLEQTVGTNLRGKTSGRSGGRSGTWTVGSQVARIGSVFGMNLIAWSQNLTPEAAKPRAQSWFPGTSCSSGPTS